MDKIFIGIDLGGTNVKIGCFSQSLELICKISTATKFDMDASAVVAEISKATKQLLADNHLSMEPVSGVGIGAPGPSDIANGVVVAAPNLPQFKNVPLKKMVSEAFGKPTAFENDANAACFGEFTVGAGRGVSDMVFLTLGTGIGGGVVSNGKLVHGYKDNAAELGHIILYPDGRLCGCGQRGCVEAYASASATARRAVEAIEAGGESSLKKLLAEKGEIHCKDVFDHCAAGDKLAEEIVDGTAEALGLLCVNLLHSTGPERIVFAGGMIAAGDLLLDKIRYNFDKHIWSMRKEDVEICFASMGEDAGIIGAAALGRENFND